MKWWLLAKQFPKYALVFGIIIGSTALFAFWWIFLRAKPHPPRDNSAELAAIRAQAAKAEARIDYLFLADSDLYDAGTGELISKDWLHGDQPTRLFYDAKSKKILGQFEQGFARYAFDGTREATMMMANPPAFFDDFKHIVFARNKNVWEADVDWRKFKFTNERQVTTIDSFYDQNFAANVFLLTSKTLAVRNLNNLLRVDLDTGNVRPMRLPMVKIERQRSPDSKWIVGAQNGQFFCYDVDADEAKTIPIGRTGIADYQWLGSDKCVCLTGGKAIAIYDRLIHTLTENVSLPFQCFKIGEPSPDGRYLFAVGGIDGKNGALVDLKKLRAERVEGGLGITWISDDTFTMSRQIQDSDLRGTWLQTIGIDEKRVAPEPYLINQRNEAMLAKLYEKGLFILNCNQGIWCLDIKYRRMKKIAGTASAKNFSMISKSTF